jgi:hypothetical protein
MIQSTTRPTKLSVLWRYGRTKNTENTLKSRMFTTAYFPDTMRGQWEWLHSQFFERCITCYFNFGWTARSLARIIIRYKQWRSTVPPCAYDIQYMLSNFQHYAILSIFFLLRKIISDFCDIRNTTFNLRAKFTVYSSSGCDVSEIKPHYRWIGPVTLPPPQKKNIYIYQPFK